MSLFTIIVPFYNVEEFLSQCIESVINQDYPFIELILVNDGSTDCSLFIGENYKKQDSRIQIVSQQNQGPSVARNIGLDMAKGKYIMFLDSDDYLSNCHVISKFAHIFNETNCDIINGVTTPFIHEGYTETNYVVKDKTLKVRNDEIKGLSTEEVIQMMFQHDNYYPSAVLKIYKKTLIDTVRFKEGIYHEDEMWSPIVLLRSKKMYFYNQPFYKRRLRKNSIMTTTDDTFLLKRMKDYLSMAEEMIFYTQEHCKNLLLKETFKGYFLRKLNTSCKLHDRIIDPIVKQEAHEILINSDLFKISKET